MNFFVLKLHTCYVSTLTNTILSSQGSGTVQDQSIFTSIQVKDKFISEIQVYDYSGVSKYRRAGGAIHTQIITFPHPRILPEWDSRSSIVEGARWGLSVYRHFREIPAFVSVARRFIESQLYFYENSIYSICTYNTFIYIACTFACQCYAHINKPLENVLE